MTVDTCPTCSAFIFSFSSVPHVCPPQWAVQRDGSHGLEDEDDHAVVRSFTAEGAIEEFCEKDDEPHLYANTTNVFRVRRLGEPLNKAKTYNVSAEYTLSFDIDCEDDEDDDDGEIGGAA